MSGAFQTAAGTPIAPECHPIYSLFQRPLASQQEYYDVPMYEYACPACKHTFEQLVPSEAAGRKTTCPKCGERNVTRQPSVFAAHAAANKPAMPMGGCGNCQNPGGCGFQN